jgi:hypothetical protein
MAKTKPIVKKWARKANKRVRTKLRKVNEAAVVHYHGPMVELTPEQSEAMLKYINEFEERAERWLMEQYGFCNKVRK